MAGADRAADDGSGNDAPAKFLCCSYAHLLRSGSKSYATAALCRVAKESPMLDLLFLGGGFLLLCLLIAYARLISQI
jgi:hypothetical protein